MDKAEQILTLSKQLNLSHRKRPSMTGSNNPKWKGDKVGYHGIHDWIRSVRGAPSECDKCGFKEEIRPAFATRDRFEWANISRKYKRDINDWIRLCIRCHRRADYYKLPL